MKMLRTLTVLAFVRALAIAETLPAAEDNARIARLQPMSGSANVLALSPQSIESVESIAGTTRVHGYLYYTTSTGVLRPIRRARVEVWDHDSIDVDDLLGQDDFIGATSTADDGSWGLSFNNVVDGWPNNPRADAYIRIYAENSAIAAVRYPFGLRSDWAQSDLVSDVPDGDYNFGSLIVAWNKASEAFLIFDSIVSAWKFIRAETDLKMPPVEVIFPCEEAGVECPGRPWFDPYVQRNIKMQRGQSEDTHVHEYGHFVMFQAYSGQWPVPQAVQTDLGECALYWSLGNYCDARVGWSEGWATFLAMAVFDRPAFDTINLETPPAGWSTSGATAGRVAAALWDAYDPGNDGCDTNHSVPFRYLFENMWFSPYTQDRFRAYYDLFKVRYPDEAHVLHAAALMNTIDYEIGPPNPTITAAPAPGEWHSGSVVLSAMANDPDTIGGDSVRFEYTINGTTWLPIAGTAIELADHRHELTWDTSTVNGGSVQVRARATDETFACSKDEGFSAPSGTFGLDNRAPGTPRNLIASHRVVPAWTNDNTIDVSWSPASDNGTAQSGVQGYRTYFHYVTNPSAPLPSPCDPDVPSVFTTGTSITSMPLRTGVYYFLISAVDRVENCSPYVSMGSFQIDVDLPSSVTLLHPAPGERTTVAPVLEWSSSSDGPTTGWPPVAGLAPYRLQLTKDLRCGFLGCFPDWSAPGVIEIRVDPSASSTVACVLPPLPPGQWYWRVYAVDRAGNAALSATSTFIAVGPDIAVEQPAGANLTNGLATVDFGRCPIGSSVELTFTIRNRGNADLAVSGITIAGVNSADFTLNSSPSATTLPGGTTRFGVTFSPRATGARTADLLIASNDSDESPFRITLTGVSGPTLTISADGHGGYLIQFRGSPGQTYRLQRATNLIGPWTTIAILTCPPSGLVQYHDTAPPARAAFYRTVQP